MPAVIPEQYEDLFSKRIFASLATLMPDGRPQVTPVWCDFDGQHVLINSAKGRQKDRNMRRDPRVSLALVDVDNPYRYLEIRGQVVEVTEEGADAHIDRMTKKQAGGFHGFLPTPSFRCYYTVFGRLLSLATPTA